LEGGSSRISCPLFFPSELNQRKVWKSPDTLIRGNEPLRRRSASPLRRLPDEDEKPRSAAQHSWHGPLLFFQMPNQPPHTRPSSHAATHAPSLVADAPRFIFFLPIFFAPLRSRRTFALLRAAAYLSVLVFEVAQEDSRSENPFILLRVMHSIGSVIIQEKVGGGSLFMREREFDQRHQAPLTQIVFLVCSRRRLLYETSKESLVPHVLFSRLPGPVTLKPALDAYGSV